MKKTNIIICTIPYNYNDKDSYYYNDFVYKLNTRLYKLWKKYTNVTLLETNYTLNFEDFFNNSKKLNHKGRTKLANEISKVINEVNRKKSIIKDIPVVDFLDYPH